MRRVSVFLTAAAFFLALANSSPGASQDLPTLFPINQHDKWGYIDQTGKIIVPPQYAAAGEFHQGRGSVKVGDKFGFIDLTGQMVISPQFDRVENFAGNLARVKIGEKWGFVDPNGNMVVSPQFDRVDDFAGGLARAEIGGKWQQCPVRFLHGTIQ